MSDTGYCECHRFPELPIPHDYLICGRMEDNRITKDQIDHPPHYGGKDNPYEVMKVIEAWELNFNLGNVLKYLYRADKKGDRVENLKKAAWYLNREIENADH